MSFGRVAKRVKRGGTVPVWAEKRILTPFGGGLRSTRALTNSATSCVGILRLYAAYSRAANGITLSVPAPVKAETDKAGGFRSVILAVRVSSISRNRSGETRSRLLIRMPNALPA